MARPTSYKPEHAEQAGKLCELGATDTDLADFFKVSDRTISRWKVEHDEFCQALKVGKEAADRRVENALYHRAIGFEHDAIKIFSNGLSVPYREKVAPDTTACIFWLKNRRPDLWRDKQTTELTGVDGGPIEAVTKVALVGMDDNGTDRAS